MPKPLPKQLTSHDLLKAAAIILMIIDHAGYYFFPALPWLRVAGRFSAPVWFYLIGYADTRRVQPKIWIGAVLVAAVWLISGQFVFPLNILFTLAFTRLAIDQVMHRALQDVKAFWGLATLLFFMALPSMIAAEYGTLGMMFAMFGYIRRHQVPLPRWMLLAFIAAASFSYILLMLALLSVNGAQFLVFCGGMAALCTLLYAFRPVTFSFAAPVLSFLGRRTLEIYVVHIMLFAAVAMVLQPERFQAFHFVLAPASLIRFFIS